MLRFSACSIPLARLALDDRETSDPLLRLRERSVGDEQVAASLSSMKSNHPSIGGAAASFSSVGSGSGGRGAGAGGAAGGGARGGGGRGGRRRGPRGGRAGTGGARRAAVDTS